MKTKITTLTAIEVVDDNNVKQPIKFEITCDGEKVITTNPLLALQAFLNRLNDIIL